MARHDDIPKTDPSEIEALIRRLKQSNLKPRDAQNATGAGANLSARLKNIIGQFSQKRYLCRCTRSPRTPRLTPSEAADAFGCRSSYLPCCQEQPRQGEKQ